MICSFPFLDKLGYAPACALHDTDYSEARTYMHKFKRDSLLSKNMRKYVKKWHAWPVSVVTFIVLSTSPFSYYKYFRNKNNLAGHFWSVFWLGLTVYQMYEYLK